MKKIIGLIMLFGFAANCFSQEANPLNQVRKNDYRSKSNNQLAAGCVFAGAGIGLIFLGINVQKNATGFDFSGFVLEALGIAAAGGSIPFFIAAANNYQRAKEISAGIKLENSVSYNS